MRKDTYDHTVFGYKPCAKCGLVKPLDEFSIDKKRPTGRAHWCRQCWKDFNNTPERKLKHKDWSRQFESSENGKKYREQYNSRPESIDKKRTRNSKPEHLARMKEYRKTARGRERHKIGYRKYMQTEKGILSAFRAQVKRRERVENSTVDFTDTDWSFSLNYWENKCAYCGKLDNRLYKDHFVPIALGGNTIPENIIPACRKCNSTKCDDDPFLWCTLLQIKRISEFLGHVRKVPFIERGLVK